MTTIKQASASTYKPYTTFVRLLKIPAPKDSYKTTNAHIQHAVRLNVCKSQSGAMTTLFMRAFNANCLYVYIGLAVIVFTPFCGKYQRLYVCLPIGLPVCLFALTFHSVLAHKYTQIYICANKLATISARTCTTPTFICIYLMSISLVRNSIALLLFGLSTL